MLLNTWPTVFYSHRHAATLPSINSTSPTKLCNDDARHHGGLVDPLLLVCGHTTSAASGPINVKMLRQKWSRVRDSVIHLHVALCAYRLQSELSWKFRGFGKFERTTE